jgi:hypothetical protein
MVHGRSPRRFYSQRATGVRIDREQPRSTRDTLSEEVTSGELHRPIIDPVPRMRLVI